MLTAPAADAACGGVERFGPTRQQRPGPPPLAIGDSVMLGALDELRRAGFELDVRGCRQMSEGLRVLSSRGRARTLPRRVVIALGYNWTISTGEIRQALRILGRRRVLGMVTPRGPMSSAREAIHAAGRRWPARVKVLDWASRSAGKAWTWDGLHLTAAGAGGFARLLSAAHDWPLPGRRAPSREQPRLRGGPGGGAIAP